MQKEFSYGVIPFQSRNDEWQVLVVQLQAGHWGFPKGHAERGESGQETAQRELREETGLVVRYWIPLSPFEEQYLCTKGEQPTQKQVTYYAALVDGAVHTQELEVKDHQWVSLDALCDTPTFPEGKALAKRVRAACPPDKLSAWDGGA